MATFPDIEPSYSVQKTIQNKAKVVRFADGYEHRLHLGLPRHQSPRQYNLNWKNVTEEQANTIDYFLEERKLDNATFDYAPPREAFTKTGTYSQSSTTISVTITDHRLFVGDSVVVDFTSGNAVDGTYIVSSITNSNVFVITAASGLTTSGNVSVNKTGISKFVCEQWTKTMNVANLANINAIFTEKFEPV